MRRLLLSLLLAASPVSAGVVTSSAPDRVAVTLYRDPNRSPEQAINLTWLNGFALVSEVRRVSLPAGDADLRFEGVAGGILPQSAIVTGLPDGIVEKNRDAYLLSAASLVERALGRRVHLRRTDKATGRVRAQEAVIRSGAEGALVLQTGDGFEALRCTGLGETLVYDGVPAGLSAKPTLSVRTRAARPVEATVTLSYLSYGFDWQANYVATLAPAGDRIDLFAWLTLANGDQTSFRDANTQAVAGRVNQERVWQERPSGQSLNLQCWPGGTTSDIPMEVSAVSEEIIVTGSRISYSAAAPPPPPPSPERGGGIEAGQEELGDLKLYRIPEPVTVTANSQKQVRFLQRRSVPVELVYRAYAAEGSGWGTVTRVMILKNRKDGPLGVPLPGGEFLLFGAGAVRPLLLGQGGMADKAVGETAEVELGPAWGVRNRLIRLNKDRLELTATNDGPRPVRVELMLPAEVRQPGVIKRDGSWFWAVTLPPNGTRILRWASDQPR
ncbi:MAG TPA: hypothetical protein VM913_07080 [Sphingomicrobium sp.]|nr:hypothetical protein [Sphingomicrobium sp.]